jgi:transposase-like protein
MEKDLNDRLAETLAVIRRMQRTAGPSLRDVAKEMGTTANQVYRWVKALREAGQIEPEANDGLVCTRPTPEQIEAEKRAHPLIEVALPSARSANGQSKVVVRKGKTTVGRPEPAADYLRRMRGPLAKPNGKIL